jgi:dipicolinate synthase subunit B
MIGYAFCGSFCTIAKSMKILRELAAEGNEIQPIVSENVYNTDTRFGKAADVIAEMERICGRSVIHTIVEAEPIGPRGYLDVLIIAPCTGNTLAKIACGITDTPVTMAAKAQLLAGKPVVIGLASNDAMAANLTNIAKLTVRKNIYFVPMFQDDIEKKPDSLICDFGQIKATVVGALKGKQIQPLWCVDA